MSAVLQFTAALDVCTCGECGIDFAAPASFISARQSDKKTFYCPNGHPRAFVESEADRLRKQLDAEKRVREFTESQLRTAREQRDRAQVEAMNLGTKVRRLKKRVANGVCPCCKRTFKQLAAHMKTKHPEFDAEPPEKGGAA